MKKINKLGVLVAAVVLILSFLQCKTQAVNHEIPFTITEKTYHYWASGVKGTNGIEIKIVGNFNTTNLSFTTIYFQNREYQIIPRFQASRFTLIGNYSVLNTSEVLMDKADENSKSKANDNIPFELEEDEALLVYTISRKNYYFKVQGVKKLENVYRP